MRRCAVEIVDAMLTRCEESDQVVTLSPDGIRELFSEKDARDLLSVDIKRYEHLHAKGNNDEAFTDDMTLEPERCDAVRAIMEQEKSVIELMEIGTEGQIPHGGKHHNEDLFTIYLSQNPLT